MTYVVTEACIKCKFMDCVEVCPVDCFYEGENMLVISPDECIDCGVCEPECPPEAIKADTESGLEKWLAVNAEYAKTWPNIAQKGEAPADAKEMQGVPDKFETNDHVVYPTHCVGKVGGIEEKEVAGAGLELFIIEFEKDKMTLRGPSLKAKAVGMRKLSSPEVVTGALNTLKGRARIKRTMWSRRAQEYEAKIDSGDLVSIAEVVRDLHRAGGQPEQSYSERQLYEKALARMAREVAAVEKTDEPTAFKRVEGMLVKKAA